MQKGKLIRLIVFSALILIVAIVAATLLNQKTYSVLYSGMEPEDAGEVMQMLSEMGVDSKPRGDDTIMVEASEVDTVRMQLAAQGYPNSGFNFDIFQNASGLGATDMDKEVYYQFQLQENIRRTIIKLDKVEDAVVNLNLSEESSFVLSNDNTPTTAAVMLMLKSGQTVNSSEVRAIAGGGGGGARIQKRFRPQAGGCKDNRFPDESLFDRKRNRDTKRQFSA